MKVRTRFAPSPTGFLHVGGLRTALYNYLFAKQNDGKFILRIEDTDQTRLVDNAITNLKQTLNLCQLHFDEEPHKGQYGPYIQSERLKIYEKYYLKLINDSFAYPCFYKKNNPNLLLPEYDKNIALLRMEREPFVVKLLINKNKSMTIVDEIRGNIEFDGALIDDPIIIKSDGFPTYHFANVIDDHLMQITHVIRGEEWISSLPIHITLYQAFNWEPPYFYHLPLLLNKDKSKLSKRQGDVSVEDFLTKGYLYNVLINFVALLGWHPAGDKELFSLDELIKEFSLDRVNKSGAIFDIKKLNWMNSLYLKNSSAEELIPEVIKILDDKHISYINNKELLQIINYSKERINTLNEITDIINMFNNKPVHYVPIKNYNYKTLFSFWIHSLNQLNQNNHSVNQKTIKTIITKSNLELSVSGKNLFIPLRYGLINEMHGPDLHTIISILGINESIQRLKNGI